MLVIRTAGCRSGMPIQESRDDQLPAVLASLSRDDIFHQHCNHLPLSGLPLVAVALAAAQYPSLSAVAPDMLPLSALLAAEEMGTIATPLFYFDRSWQYRCTFRKVGWV
jgi:hypothetical protein